MVFRQSCLEGALVVQTSQGDIPIRDLHGVGQVWSLGDANMLQRRNYEGSFAAGDGPTVISLQNRSWVRDPRQDDHRFYTPGGYLPLADILYGGR